MIFNSAVFAIYLPVVFILYWFVFNKSATAQNVFLSVASLFFYGWSNWLFLGIILFSAGFNFIVGTMIEDAKNLRVRKRILWLGILINIGIIGYFKYFDFFYQNVGDLIFSVGYSYKYNVLQAALPIGLSFFTFQSIAYLIDIYHEKINATRNGLVFITFISFFPKLLAGPIELAQKFIPQIEKRRSFDYNTASNGLQQILWGLFKKTVIADNCIGITNHIFENYPVLSGSTLLMGAFFYTIQLYADFSGYSDMAIGISKLFGIQLSKNFNFPLFANSISDFWRKWHISLSSWMMNYIFTPLSFILRKYKKVGLIVSICFTFSVVGLWHGPNWTYILFGVLHGCYFIPLILNQGMFRGESTTNENAVPSVMEALRIFGTFFSVMFSMILFRSANVSNAFQYVRRLFSFSLFSVPYITREIIFATLLVVTMLLIEFFLKYKKEYMFAMLDKKNKSSITFAFFIIIILVLMNTKEDTVFIYFKY